MNKSALPAIPGTRRCGNCACFRARKPDAPLEQLSGVCMRDGPFMALHKAEVPVFFPDGRARIDRNGRPMTQTIEKAGLEYAPTHALLVCYDGWRPAEYRRSPLTLAPPLDGELAPLLPGMSYLAEEPPPLEGPENSAESPAKSPLETP